MSNLESHFRSSEGVSMSSDEIDSFIEECRSFILKSKNPVRCPEEMSAVSHKELVSECFVDFLTEKEVKNIRKKLFSYWETTKTQQKYGEVVETFNPNRLLQDSEPTTQSEEAVISFEDAKSEVPSTSKRLVPHYDIEQLIEAELKDLRNSKFSEDYSCSSTETMHEAKFPAIESMDFTGIEKASDLPGIADIELSQQTLPVLNRTDVLEVLLRIYEYSIIDFAETAITRIAMNEIGDLPTQSNPEVQEFSKHLVDEIKIIYGRLIRIYSSGTHRAPENVETSDSSSSNTKDSSSSRLTSPAILSTSAYPELTTASQARDEDNTISSLPFSPMDSNSSSASGLINDPVIDMAAAQPKSSTSSSGESVSNTNTSSTSVTEDNNTMSGISSLPTDPRSSVSSMKDIDTRISVSSLKDIYPRSSVSSLKDVDKRKSASSLKDIESFDVMSSNVPQGRDVNPRTSVSSSRDVNPGTSVSSLIDVDNRTTVSSLRDIESLDAVMSSDVLPQQLLSEDISDDAFLTAPLVATADDVPSMMDSIETAQNPRRRGRSSKGDEDKNKAKRTAH